MNSKIFTFIFLLSVFFTCGLSANSIIKWSFDRPFDLADLSESNIPANDGISTQSSSVWTVTTPSVGGAINGNGYQSVSGWDFGSNPNSYFLFPDITIPTDRKSTRLNSSH